MTLLNLTTDSPPAINDFYKGLAWMNLLAHELFQGLTYPELPGAPLERVVDQNIVPTADGTIRLITRSCIRLNKNYVTGPNKLWTYALPFEDGNLPAIPAAFKID